MANRTVKDAQTIKGTNPQYLVEKIIRTRIYDSQYWKEDCFALTGTQDCFAVTEYALILRGVRVFANILTIVLKLELT